MKSFISARVPLVLLLVIAFTLAPLAVAHGSSTAVHPCSEAGLDAALAAGGTNTFSCAAATTIVVSDTKTVSVDGTVLDGGGLLTISGGGVRQVFMVNEDVMATFANLTIRDGSAPNGGGIYSMGSLVIANVYFLDNQTTGAGGAVIANGPALTVSGSTFSGNVASGSGMGGAIFIGSPTAPMINNSTFFNNTAQRGGAILTSGSEVALKVTACTFAGNHATNEYGATGIFNTNGSVTLRNTLLSTAEGRNCNGLITDAGHNLQYGGHTTSCGSTITTGDPLLGPLANNGGMTPTMALLPGSQAIDQIPVPKCGLSADQRGYHRPAFGGISTTCDIGAFEVESMMYLPLGRR